MFAYKFAFTVSMSQLPIVVKPGETKYIDIYYSPTNINWQYDTMYISDNCSVIAIPLSGFGEKNFGEGVTDCDVPVNMGTRSIDVPKIMTLKNPVPNPTSSQGKIPFTLIIQSDTELELDVPIIYSLNLFDVYGNKISLASSINIFSRINKENQLETNGEFIFDLQKLPLGVYLIQIIFEGKNFVFPIVKY
jgi:hypothetical protein